MGQRILPAALPVALASIGFLVTFTVRSWNEGLWHPGNAAAYVMSSSTQHHAAAHAPSVMASAVRRPQPLASVLRQEVARLRGRVAAVLPAAAPAIAPAAAIYLAERDREESHNGRLR
jgi:hypothetical protein